MSIIKSSARSGLWFAAFRILTQTFTWIITIIIARILNPGDYGLMAMVSIATEYLGVFSELGLGSAIIQRKEITQNELSSNFWFSIFLGLIIAAISIPSIYLISWIFKEQRLIFTIPLIAILFVIGSLMIVPFNLLMRECKFKEIGVIQFSAGVMSSLSMLFIARAGYGFWTLVWGTFISRLLTITFVFIFSGWRPAFHFKFKEVQPFLKFGLNIIGSRSLYAFLLNSDKLIVGKILGSQALGLYSFSMELVSVPSDKIVSLINQVSFPILSRIQNDIYKVQEIYMRITRYITIMVAPLYLGGAFFGYEIVQVILGEKWLPLVFLFKMLCLSQLIVSFTTLDSVVHNAQSRPHWPFRASILYAVFMPVSVFIAAHFGLNALVYPWIVIYPLLRLAFTYATLKKLQLSLFNYLNSLLPPLLGSLFMVAGILIVKFIFTSGGYSNGNIRSILIQEIITGALLYSFYVFLFEKKCLYELMSLRKN